MRAFLEYYLHNTLAVRKNRFVAITKVETPNFHVFIRRACCDQFRIIRDIHTENRQL